MAESYDLVIVGAGISGLAFLLGRAQHRQNGRVLVVDHRPAVGGFLGAALPAEEFPEESAILRAWRPGAWEEIRLNTTAVGLAPGGADAPHSVLLRTGTGASHITTQRVVIATGGLERPREHDAIPGTRPAGIMTPVLVHQFLAQGYLPGRRAVVYGDGRAALLVARRLGAAGADVTLVPPLGAVQPVNFQGVPVVPPAAIVAIAGQARLEAVTLRRGEQIEEVEADTLVYAIGALPNTLWLKGSGLVLNEDGTIQIDSRYQTSTPGIFAIGTVTRSSLDHHGSVASGRGLALVLGEAR